MGMVARRLVGETVNAAPVLTLITQFGGGKTHTLTALYHLVKNHDYAKAIGGDFAVSSACKSSRRARGLPCSLVMRGTQVTRADAVDRYPGSSPATPESPR